MADTDANEIRSNDVIQLQALYDLMQSEGLESLELEDETIKVKLHRTRRTGPSDFSHHRVAFHPTAPAPTSTPTAPVESSNRRAIVTPLAGVFYRASSPTSAPYAQEGAVVEPGQTLCIVEAMKVMNEIKAESRCRIVKITAENSRPVTAGQTLFLVEPA